MLVFFDNCAMRLTAALAALSLRIEVAAEAGSTLPNVGEGLWTFATLSDPSNPSRKPEVVELHLRESSAYRILRPSVTSSTPAWPIGTLVDCRVNASLLGSFVQGRATHLGAVVETAAPRFEVMGVPGWFNGKPSAEQIGETHAYEAIRRTQEMLVGPTDMANVWTPDADLYEGVYVSPDDVFQTQLEISSTSLGYVRSGATFPYPPYEFATHPSFPGEKMGRWRVAELSVAKFSMMDSCLVTEVGFVATEFNGHTVAPVVSVGTFNSPKRFVDSQAMTQITGNRHVQRFPLSGGGAPVSEVQFTIESRADQHLQGFFYFKGMTL